MGHKSKSTPRYDADNLIKFCLLQFQFETFYADDHLSSMMLLDEKRKQLDFQFILWKFDTQNLNMAILHKMDVGLEQLKQE